MLGTLVVWTISYLGCADKQSGFWGDVYRYIGFSSMALTLIACWIISKYFKFEKWLLWLFMAVSCVVFGWQILNMYGIDPLNWQMDRQYTWLVSVFANVNQNAVFDATALAVAVGAFLVAENRVEQILYGVVVFLAMAGGIASHSETFYFGAAVALVIAVGYAWTHVECMWRAWMTCALFWAAVLVQKLGYNKWILKDEKLYYAWMLEAITGLLFKPKTMILMAVIVIVYGAIIILCNKKMDKIGKIVKNVYIGAIAVVVATVGAVVVYANTVEIDPASGSFLLNLKIQESFGGYRGTIWRVTMSMFGDSNVFQKLFGIGMDNFSTQAYVNYAEDLQVFGDAVLADAHSLYFDMLASSGIFGVIGFFGVIAGVLCKNVKQLKENKMAVGAVMYIGAYLLAGTLNGHLIVTTPVFFVLLGCFWKNSRQKVIGSE